jgi:uncharacterized repeat protein (TIGR01451 family)
MGKWWRASGSRRPSRPESRVRPRLEALEDRICPSTLTVNTLNTSGNGSLPTLLQKNATEGGGNTIVFGANLNGTIYLTSALTNSGASVTIANPNGDNITISGAPAAGQPGAVQDLTLTGGSGVVVSISGQSSTHTGSLTFTKGSVGGGVFFTTSAKGGSIFNSANTTLNNVAITNSTATSSGTAEGGGIFNSANGILTLNGVTVSGNSASGNAFGAGIYNSGTLTFTSSTVSGNTASGNSSFGTAEGGGIYSKGTLTFTSSTVSGNTATGNEAKGGGIYEAGNHTLTLTKSTVSGNSASGSGSLAEGGGIYTSGALTLTGSTVSSNTSSASGSSTAEGGGIYTLGGLSLSGSTVSSNAAQGAKATGGGIYESGAHTLTLTNSTVSGNAASASSSTAEGGGLYTKGATLTVATSTVSGNSAGGSGSSTAEGGGIYNSGGGALTFTSSTVSGNSAITTSTAKGGGIYTTGTLTLTSSTVSGNSAKASGSGGLAEGGGIYITGTLAATNDTLWNNSLAANGSSGTAEGGGLYLSKAASATLVNVTVGDNAAAAAAGGTAKGGGIFNSGTLYLANTIVFDPRGPTGSPDVSGTIADAQNDVFGGTSTNGAGYTITNSYGTIYTSATLGLGSLANNGGPTQTVSDAGTIAVDAGATNAAINPVFGTSVPSTDQRGDPRPDVTGSNPDIGAYEYQTEANLSITKTGPSTVTAGTDATYTITLTDSGPGPVDAANVVLTDTLPTGAVLLSVTPAVGNPDTFTRTVSSGTVTETANNPIAPGSVDVFTVVVGAPSTLANGATFNNTASVTSTTPDDNPASDLTSTVNGTIVAVGDLSVTKTGPATVTAGTDATYTITMANSGPSVAQNVVLTDTLPTGATPVSITPAGTNPDTFTLGGSGNTITETASTVGVGHTDVFTLVVLAANNLSTGASFADTASLSSSTADDSPAGDLTSTVNSTITTVADLSVTKTGPGAVAQGSQITYTMTVSNSGPNEADAVVLTDTLPAGLSFVSASASQGTIGASGNSVVYTLGTIGSGNSATATVVLQDTFAGTYTDTASATTTSIDTNSNPTASATTVVSEAPIFLTAQSVSATEFSPLNNAVVALFAHTNGMEPAGSFSAVINWGDGTTTPGTVVQTGATYAVLGSHTYNANGNYTVTVTVAADGGAASATGSATASVGNAGLPPGADGGPIAVFVNDLLENLFHQPLTGGQVNQLVASLELYELGLADYLVTAGGTNPLFAMQESSSLTDMLFQDLATFLASQGTSLNATVSDLSLIFLSQVAVPLGA